MRPAGAAAAGGGAVLKIFREAASTTDEGLKKETRTSTTGTIVTEMWGSGERTEESRMWADRKMRGVGG